MPAAILRRQDGTYLLEHEQLVPLPIEKTFDFFSRAENLQDVTPAWLRFSLIGPAPEIMARGAIIQYRLRLNGMPVYWRTLIAEWDPPHLFTDIQQKGPYSLWRHEHRFEPNAEGTRVIDRVHYRVPLGLLGHLVHRLYIRRQLLAIWRFREQRIEEIMTGSGRSLNKAGGCS